MDFRILGPLEVSDEGKRVALSGEKQRALLALLIVHIGETLATDRLVDELWGEEAPGTATQLVQVRVSRLRKALATGGSERIAGVVVTRENGYELAVDPECVDALRFERLVAEGKLALMSGSAADAVSRLEEALALWRGRPLDDLVFERFAQREIARLEALRVVALEELVEAKLAIGWHAEVLPQLEALIAEHPYRERLRAQLILALYRSDRQADALQAYRDAREALVQELGIEPGERLRDLERRILAQDAALSVAAQPTRDPPMSRLPASPTRTIGRDGDRESVARLVRRPGVRLVTLTGPGGVGKTRLALDVARQLETELPDGVRFVSLAPTASAEHVPSSILRACGTTALPGEAPEVAVERLLAAKHVLLVLDNFEHVLPAARLVSDLLIACERLKVLVTSREALRIHAEHRYTLSSLSVPANDEPATVERSSAAALFVERARSHDQGFHLDAHNAAAISGICRRLDGLPLAIELAAARTTMLDPHQLNARLAQALDALGTGPRDTPDRQRTLRATLDWSHRLLNAPEQRAFARFAVFAGGATVTAAQTITGASLATLEGLLDKQLLLRRSGPDGEPRLSMLETVREYASERLDAEPGAPDTRDRHLRHYLALAERAQPELSGHEAPTWLARLDVEIDNLRAASDRSLADPVLALQMVRALITFWSYRNASAEGLKRAVAAMRAAGDDAPAGLRGAGQLACAYLVGNQSLWYDPQGEIRSHARLALELYREADDYAGRAWALLALSFVEQAEDAPQRRLALAEQALSAARAAGDEVLTAVALSELALALPIELGKSELERAEAALRQVGHTRQLTELYWNVADNMFKEGMADHAGPWLDRAIELASAIGDPWEVMCVRSKQGTEALLTGHPDRAEFLFGETLRLCTEHPFRELAAEALAGMAAAAALGSRPERAATLLGAATAAGPIGSPRIVEQIELRYFEPGRASINRERWKAALDVGASLSVDEAIAVALDPSSGQPGQSQPNSRERGQ